MFSELFWLILSFAILAIILYKPLKKAIKSKLDNDISIIEDAVLDSLQARIEAKIALDTLHAEYNSILSRKKHILEEAYIEAEKIVKASQQKVLSIVETYEQLMRDDMEKSKTEVINRFKKEILIAAISAIEDMMLNSEVKKKSGMLKKNAAVFKNILH